MQADSTFIFPPPNSGILQVSEPVGVNTFEVIATRSPRNSEDHDSPESSKNVDLIPPSVKTEDELSRCSVRFEVTKVDK